MNVDNYTWFAKHKDIPCNFNDTFDKLLEYSKSDNEDKREAAMTEIEARAIKAAHKYTCECGYISHATMANDMVKEFMQKIKEDNK